MQQSNDKSWWQPGLILFGRLSSWIAGPVIIALFIGKWIDRKYQVDPWGTIGIVGIAFIVSMFGIVKEGMKEMDNISKIYQQEKKKPESGKHDLD